MDKIVITQPSESDLIDLDISTWSPWECEPSRFDWEYDNEEWAYLFEGLVKIKTERGDEVEIKKGDLVKFPKSLKCNWHVIQKVRKVYTFK